MAYSAVAKIAAVPAETIAVSTEATPEGGTGVYVRVVHEGYVEDH